MRKMMKTVAAVLVVLCTASAGFAAGRGDGKVGALEKQQTVKGTVISVDRAKDLITLRSESTHAPETVSVKADEITKLKIGDVVRIVLEPETDIAQKVIVEKQR